MATGITHRNGFPNAAAGGMMGGFAGLLIVALLYFLRKRTVFICGIIGKQKDENPESNVKIHNPE